MGLIFIGEVRAMPFGFAPPGWMACKGQLLPIGSNTALFSLLQITYGGDGETDFGLPHLPPLAAETGTLQYCIAVAGTYPGRPEAEAEAEGEIEAEARSGTVGTASGGDQADYPYLGETRIFAFPFAPAGWTACEGQSLPTSEYPALFKLIGTTYGGDGTTTFGLPAVTGPVSPDGPLTVGITLFGPPPAAGAEAEAGEAEAEVCA